MALSQSIIAISNSMGEWILLFKIRLHNLIKANRKYMRLRWLNLLHMVKD